MLANGRKRMSVSGVIGVEANAAAIAPEPRSSPRQSCKFGRFISSSKSAPYCQSEAISVLLIGEFEATALT